MKALLVAILAITSFGGVIETSYADEPVSPEPSIELSEKLGIADGETQLPGVAFAEGLSQLTGVAISPLLGVSVIGTWKYFNTPEEARGDLPWICHPAFWSVGLGILLLCFFKDTIGTIAPSFIKKPLDFLELFEDKFSAVIAGTAFVPFLVEQYARHGGEHEIAAFISHESIATTATIPAPSLAMIDSVWIITPIALIGFFTVWIVSHAITVLAALSPFRLLEVFLKITRLGILGLMTMLYLISPVIAAILSGFVIIICAFLAPKAFRLSVYGTVIGTDFIRSLIHHRPYDPERLRSFLVKQGNSSLKAGSFGAIIPASSGRIVFRSRWFFFGKERAIALPEKENLVLADGILFPTLRQIDLATGKEKTLVHFLPRYRHCSEEIAKTLGIENRKTVVARGFHAARAWALETFSGSKRLTTGEEGPLS
tara:strand:+ start:358 stop:1641 length:1284 start_codon:yes stop_codon:yes gene_type:complete